MSWQEVVTEVELQTSDPSWNSSTASGIEGFQVQRTLIFCSKSELGIWGFEGVSGVLCVKKIRSE